MQGLVVFLIILLGLFITVAVVLAMMIIGLSRRISRVQHNTKKISDTVNRITTLTSVGSSVLALGLKAKAGLGQFTKKDKRNEQKAKRK